MTEYIRTLSAINNLPQAFRVGKEDAKLFIDGNGYIYKVGSGLESEATRLKQLARQGLAPTVHNYDQSDDEEVIVMEYLQDYCSLSELLNRESLDLESRLSLIGALAHALDTARNLINGHPDLHPGNIMVKWDQDNNEFKIKFIDVGIKDKDTIVTNIYAHPATTGLVESNTINMEVGNIYSFALISMRILNPNTFNGYWNKNEFLNLIQFVNVKPDETSHYYQGNLVELIAACLRKNLFDFNPDAPANKFQCIVIGFIEEPNLILSQDLNCTHIATLIQQHLDPAES